MSSKPIADAVLAVTMITPKITHAVAKAGDGPRADQLRRLRVAQLHARDLLTRLEIAELELAALPDKTGESRQ